MSTPPALRYALAIHGGAGAIPRDLSDEERSAYHTSLTAALGAGLQRLERGDSSLDVVESVVRQLEDDPLFNAGRGSVFTHTGGHELDAAIMDGATLACGAVAAVRTIRNPVTLARRVMERTPHILLAGEGAEGFADEVGVERVDPTWFDTEHRYRQWQSARELEVVVGDAGGVRGKYGTVGCVARDQQGNLAAATSTGGLTNKRVGRIGDTPLIGAGTYANNATCAVSGTGLGEQFMRHAVAFQVSALMEFTGRSLEQAADFVVHQRLRGGDGGLIAVDAAGRVVMPFNSAGMHRGAADSGGRFETAIG